MNILFPGPLSTVQDMSRTGHAAQGYPECGACDKYALALGNLLCGNPETAAAVEMTLAGATVQFDQDAVVALTGASCAPTLNGCSIPLQMPVHIPAGATLEIGTFTAGLRAYLCVRGGVDVTPVLGSRSTDAKCRIGGLEGRALRKGDRLPIGQSTPGYVFDRAARAARILASKPWLLRPRTVHSFMPRQAVPLLRAVPGPQDDAFTSEGLHTFFSDMYTVTTDSNRMGVKLSGPAVAAKNGSDIARDIPKYRVYEHGVLTGETTDVSRFFDDPGLELVSFLIGCSFSFETALLEAGVPVRQIEEGVNVPMYNTNIPCTPAGAFSGNMVVSMRPIPHALVPAAVAITAQMPRVHGMPVQIGCPEAIGIRDLEHPDYGDAVTIREGEVPVFWPCGVTPQNVVMHSKPPFVIIHAPGHMFITDVKNAVLKL